jgi:hypothetical protein
MTRTTAVPNDSDIHFRGALPLDCRETLEHLFFFNPGQLQYQSAIRRTVETYGMPVIHESSDRLTLRLDGATATETLFLLERCPKGEVLRGAMMFSRVPMDTLMILHLAVAPGERSLPAGSATNWAGRLVQKALEIAHQVRGISFVGLPYSGNRLSIQGAGR